jgi:hypothetical protein
MKAWIAAALSAGGLVASLVALAALLRVSPATAAGLVLPAAGLDGSRAWRGFCASTRFACGPCLAAGWAGPRSPVRCKLCRGMCPGLCRDARTFRPGTARGRAAVESLQCPRHGRARGRDACDTLGGSPLSRWPCRPRRGPVTPGQQDDGASAVSTASKGACRPLLRPGGRGPAPPEPPRASGRCAGPFTVRGSSARQPVPRGQ